MASPPLSPTGGGSSLAVVPAAGAADDELALPSVDEIVGAMRSPDEVQRGEAIDLLSELVNSAYGEDGRALAQAVRDAGGIALLAWMLTDPSLRVQQQTLLILGNLCSNSFDPASEETKALLMECAARNSPAQFFGAGSPTHGALPQVRRRACPPLFSDNLRCARLRDPSQIASDTAKDRGRHHLRGSTPRAPPASPPRRASRARSASRCGAHDEALATMSAKAANAVERQGREHERRRRAMEAARG